MGQKSFTGYQLVLIITDILVINLIYIISLSLREGFFFSSINYMILFRAIPWISIISIAVLSIFDLYSYITNVGYFNILYSIILSVAISTIFIIGAIYIIQVSALPRFVVFLSAVLQVVVLSLVHITANYISKKRQIGKRILLIGENLRDIAEMADKFMRYGNWLNICDYIDSANIDLFEEKAETSDIVVINGKVKNKEDIISYCVSRHKEILMVPDMFGIALYSSEIQFIDDSLMFSMKPLGLKSYQEFIKRGFDVALSAAMLFVFSPLMVIVSILIRLSTPGPALFKQERLGLNGKPFDVLKFRTMVNNAEELSGPVLSTENDSRITKVGSFLRATRIDELPQLINVFLGDMSIIGPRPERSYFVDNFSKTIPSYAYRMAVRPGITGLAQVIGRYTTTAEDKLRFDLMYIRNYSLFLDFKILLKTLKVVFEIDKAAGLKNEAEIERKFMCVDPESVGHSIRRISGMPFRG